MCTVKYSFTLQVPGQFITISPKKDIDQTKVTDKGHVCSRCGNSYSYRKSLLRHMQTHTGRFTHYCDLCKKGFHDSTAYRSHQNKHDGILYKCGKCASSFSSAQSRDRHMSVHTGVYRFTCNICGGGFNKKYKYDKHCKKHLKTA